MARMLFIVAHCMAVSAAYCHAGDIFFDPPKPSFGVIGSALGPDPKLTVKLRNGAGHDIQISRVAVGCGCLQAAFPTTVTLHSGESTPVEVTLRLAAMHVGEMDYPLTVFDENGPVARAGVTYAFRPAVDAEPREITLSEDFGETSTKCYARIDLLDSKIDGPLRVESATADLVTDLIPATPDGRSYQLSIGAAKGCQVGKWKSEVRLYAKNREKPAMVVPVNYEIVSPVSAQPGRILTARLIAGQKITRSLRLRSSNPFHVASISTNDPQLHVTGGQWVNGALVCEVEISPTASTATNSRTLEAKVSFVVDSPAQFNIDVPVVGEISPAKASR